MTAWNASLPRLVGGGWPGSGSGSRTKVVAACLRQLAVRLDGFRARLGEVERAAQSRSGSTSRSTRDSRSPKRSRSS
jgi:hypothetical protein